MTQKITWSYSSLSLFQQCPRKYYHLRVLKDIKEPESEQMRYGLDLHKAAELYIGEGVPLEPGFAFMQPVLDKLKAMEGEKLCEYRMGLTRSLEPCEFFGSDVWWRGVADLAIIRSKKAKVLDYKTGKDKYADTKQLELLALATFKHFPDVEEVDGGLLFVIHNNLIKEKYTRADEAALWRKWLPEAQKLEDSYEKGVWNAKPNFTCRGWCPVTSCQHNSNHK